MSVSLVVREKFIFSEYLREKFSLNVSMYWSTKPVEEIDDEPDNDDDKESENDDEEPTLTTKNDSESEYTIEDESIVDDTSDLVALKILPSSSEGGIESFTEEDAVEIECSTKLVDDSDALEWVIDADFCCLRKDCRSLVVRCKLSGAISSETVQVLIELAIE